MGREKAQEVGKIAEALLLVAGGNPAEASKYYAIADGGADDIFGMTTTEAQLQQWNKIGVRGSIVYKEFLSHCDDEPMAYGAYCFNADTLNAIKDALNKFEEAEADYRAGHVMGCSVN